MHEPAGLDLQGVLSLVQRAQLFRQGRVGTDPVLLDFAQLEIDLRQRFLERLDEILDGLLPSIQVEPGGVLKLGQGCLREIEKRLVVLPEGIRRERGEGVAQLRLGILEERQLFRRSSPLGVELGFEAGAGGRELARQASADERDLAIRLRAHDQPDTDRQGNSEKQQARDDQRHKDEV